MSWWVWVIIIFVILGFIGIMGGRDENHNSSSSQKNTPRSNKKASSVSTKSAKEIANEISTPSHFKSLERKLEKADQKRMDFQSYDSRSSKREDDLEKKYQVLQEAFDMASKKVLRWQFIPNIDIETPLNTLSNAYKVFSPHEYEEKFIELGSNKEEWYGIQADDEPDEKDPELKFLLKLRTIAENNELTKEEITKKINSLASRNKEEAECYFDLKSKIKPGEQWYTKNT